MGSSKLFKKIRYAMRFIPDSAYIQINYFARFKHFAHLKNPETYNEKLNWLKLHDRNPLYTRLVDKYEVKDYVANVIGSEYIIPTLGVWDHFDEIDFDELPAQFALKCTHDSGGLVIVEDKEKMDKKSAKKIIESSLKHNFYYIGREWPYKNVKPRIIAEQYICDDQSDDLIDYKFMCFNGKVKSIFTCTDRHLENGLKVTFFDREWKKMRFERRYPFDNKKIKAPKNLSKMIELAEVLSSNIPFVRVDFYEINEKIYFGELTFYPGCGFEKFKPEKWDRIFGDWLELPK